MVDDIRPDDFTDDDQPSYREKVDTPVLRPASQFVPMIPTADAVQAKASARTLSALARHQRKTPAGRARFIETSVQNGRVFVHVAGVEGTLGTFVPMYPECPHCKVVHTREVRNPFLESAIEIFTGAKRIVWAATLSCDTCIGEFEAKTATARAERKRLELEACGFGKAMITWSFATFPQQNSEWLKRARDYVASGAPHDIVIWGQPGIGKTGLGVGILQALHADGRKAVRFIRATEFMLLLRDSISPHSFTGKSELEIIQTLADVPYLMVDDLSSIQGTAYQDEIMQTLIDMRQREGRPTILTLNLRVAHNADPAKALMNFFGDRVYDRLREYGEEWRITGHSMRKGR